MFLRTPLTELQRYGLEFLTKRESETAHGQFGGFICDELGTGKTLQMLAHICNSLVENPTQKTLVIAPAAVLYTWKAEAEKHFVTESPLKIGIYHGPKRHETLDFFWRSHNVFVMSYTTASKEIHQQHNTLFSHAQNAQAGAKMFNRIVLDEAHHIRNTKTAVSRGIDELHKHARFKWCMTATPIWNTIDDLWPLIAFLGAYPLADRVSWLLEMNTKEFNFELEIMPKLNAFLAPIMLRRDKSALDLVECAERVVNIELTENERLFYDSLYLRARARVEHLLRIEKWLKCNGLMRALKTRVQSNYMSLFLRLRQVCVHPQIVLDALGLGKQDVIDRDELRTLFDSALNRLRLESVEQQNEECAVCLFAAPDHCAIPCGHKLCGDCFAIIDANRNDNAMFKCPTCRAEIQSYRKVADVLNVNAENAMEQNDIIEAVVEDAWKYPSSKMLYILQDMQRRNDQNVKFVIFSQWLTSLNLFSRFFTERNMPHLRIDGTQSIEKRNDIQTKFNTEENSEHRILLVSLMAGAEGLNLQRASVVYFTDVWWTAARVDQAANRVHRIGQTRAVDVVHLIASNTVEERAWQIQNAKREIGTKVMGGAQRDFIQRVFELQ